MLPTQAIHHRTKRNPTSVFHQTALAPTLNGRGEFSFVLIICFRILAFQQGDQTAGTQSGRAERNEFLRILKATDTAFRLDADLPFRMLGKQRNILKGRAALLPTCISKKSLSLCLFAYAERTYSISA